MCVFIIFARFKKRQRLKQERGLVLFLLGRALKTIFRGCSIIHFAVIDVDKILYKGKRLKQIRGLVLLCWVGKSKINKVYFPRLPYITFAVIDVNKIHIIILHKRKA